MKRVATILVCGLALGGTASAQTQPQPFVTILKPTMPDLPPDPDAMRDGSPKVCRPPQPQTDSRLLGPTVCLSQRQWDDLHAKGLDISADGETTVASEKFRSLNKGSCHTTQDSCF
jgi:hypothetical protein